MTGIPDASLSAKDLPATQRLAALIATYAGAAHEVSLDCDPAVRLSGAELDSVATIVGEAVSNALSHAFPAGREGHVWIKLIDERGRLRLSIRDDGVGINDLPAVAQSSGVRSIEAAAESLGGYARMGSAPFGGGLVSVTWRPAA